MDWQTGRLADRAAFELGYGDQREAEPWFARRIILVWFGEVSARAFHDGGFLFPGYLGTVRHLFGCRLGYLVRCSD